MNFSQCTAICATAFMAGLFLHRPAKAETLDQTVGSYFAELAATLNRTASARELSASNAQTVNEFLTGIMKANPGIHSLVRANAAGAVVNEVVRGEQKLRGNRLVSGENWFRQVRRQGGEYRSSVVQGKQGHRILWAKPLYKAGVKGRKKIFAGAVAAEIDLHDCFEQIAASGNLSCRISTGGNPIYSRDWDPSAPSDSFSVTIPGLGWVELRSRKPEPPRVAPVAPAAVEKKADPAPVRQAAVSSGQVLLVCGTIIGCGLLVLLVRILLWNRQRRALRHTDEESLSA